MTNIEKLFAGKKARIEEINAEIRKLNAERRSLYREVNTGSELLKGLLAEAEALGEETPDTEE